MCSCMVPRGALTMLVLGSMAALNACGHGDANLRTRSAFDLGCPQEKLTITPLQSTPGQLTGSFDEMVAVAGVEGCGKKVTYVSRDGTWIMNNEAATTTTKPSTR